jgi:hypothetical protein
MFDDLLKLIDAGYEVTFRPAPECRALEIRAVTALKHSEPNAERFGINQFVSLAELRGWPEPDSLVAIEIQRLARRLPGAVKCRHQACPTCGNESIEQTTMGSIIVSGDCPRRGTKCGACGWQGTHHDLVPRKNP